MKWWLFRLNRDWDSAELYMTPLDAVTREEAVREVHELWRKDSDHRTDTDRMPTNQWGEAFLVQYDDGEDLPLFDWQTAAIAEWNASNDGRAAEKRAARIAKLRAELAKLEEEG